MISISGIDGAGKTTQIEILKDYWEKRGKIVKVLWGRGGWSPGIITIGKMIKVFTKMNKKERLEYRANVHSNPKKQKILLILSILDLYQYFGFLYRLHNIFASILICDRYVWDTYVDFKVNYSGFDFENWFIWKVLLKIIPKPVHSFMLYISADESLTRCVAKNELDIECIANKKDKVALYEAMMLQKKWRHVLDGTLSKEKISQNILSAVKV